MRIWSTEDWRSPEPGGFLDGSWGGIVCTIVFFLLLAASSLRGQEWLDKLDDSLFLQTPKGLLRFDLSGLLDLEGYYIDPPPPGLIFSDDQGFFNPRLSLFLDTHLGKHLYSLVQVRFDRGFDPGLKPDGDARFDEYFLRYTPFDDARLNIQAGRFPTVVGNFVPRHLSWDNPFINAPLPYERVLTISDQSAPPAPAAFLNRRNIPDRKTLWVPLIWGPSYAAGASLFGAVKGFDYAVELKNASISSRPSTWDPHTVGWDHPTASGRLALRPNAMWNFGVSASGGAYLLPEAEATLPSGKNRGDYNQLTLGTDLNYAWRHWQLWAEVFVARFEVPNVGNADSFAYYLEAKYKITAGLFAAVRWNQQFFGKVRDGAGGQERWDQDTWRSDAALGYRFTRHLQAKLQYSYSHQQGPVQQGEQLVAGQVTLKF